MFTIYIAKAAANYGLTATRPIYERALEVLPDKQTARMSLRFAALERKLGEIDRARVDDADVETVQPSAAATEGEVGADAS